MKETLEAIGSTESYDMGGASNVSMIYTLAGVSGTVVIRAEGTHDGTTWVNLDENGNTNITANGTYGFEKGNVSYSKVRLTWVSGTATSVIASFSKNGG